ncbi:glycoside hydrolase family 3 N-terminal domain-containing protein [Phreatobacter sp.]|uniref:glycoside hydrolase family 3 N-terminal domain-containing protein n=1 Tax=Phreatobacter sp. TaxID=1966341 RepID=UPI0022C41E70|nr:glycoside hydrolase family 3 N-terminal domain-containing protein [Phreatobacter sp.]MCZ8314816.1 glycoside hydrolase family 3 C-terminal domain-containing protein [Phreatobacter sp.]
MPIAVRWLLAAALLLAVTPASAQTPAPPVPAAPPVPRAWKTGDEAAAIERRIDDLIARMTLEEKVGQLNLWGRGDEFRMEWVEQGRTGAVMNFVTPSEIVAVQQHAARSRLRIPPIIALDAINGFATYMPQPLGQAATFNPRLVELASYWSAREARAVGINWTFAPMIDMTRDARWGRVMEGAGEDVHLASILAAVRTIGYHRGGLATSAKHYIGYGEAESGRDYNSVWIPVSKLWDYHMPPFQASLAAGVFTVMTSLSAMNGIASTADRHLVADLLKGQLGFRGFVVSDFESVKELIAHGQAADGSDAVRRAFGAGIDMDMMAGLYDAHLARLVRDGAIPEAAVNDSVRRVLRVKMHMGLFEEAPYDPALARRDLGTAEARAASLEVAREAVILLRNERGILPFKPSVRSVAVIGSLATHQADWQYTENAGLPRVISPRLTDALAAILGSRVRVTSAPAFATHCSLAAGDTAGAVATARAADVAVVMLGEDCEQYGEGTSRAHLDLPAHQQALLDAVIATGKPVVVIMHTSRPFVLTRFIDRVAAVIQAFHLGTEGRTAIAEVLTGRTNPSGKLPMTFPRATGQVPIYYDRLPTGRPRIKNFRYETGYLDESMEPLFPFGFGLSFSRFSFDQLALASASVPRSGTVAGSVRLTNAAGPAGQEVVQVYVRQRVGERSRPVRQLKFFQKVAVAAGGTQTVSFSIPVQSLGYHDDAGRYVVEPGTYDIFVGGDSNAALTASITVTE